MPRLRWVGDDAAYAMRPGWFGIGCHTVNGTASQDDPNNHNGNHNGTRSEIKITAGCIVQWYTNATVIPAEPTVPDQEWARSPLRTCECVYGELHAGARPTAA